MKLSALWSSITGSRVKEITPQAQQPWLDDTRPATSGDVRSLKRARHTPERTQSYLDLRSQSSAGENIRRLSRSLSRSRRKPSRDIKHTETAIKSVPDAQKDVPEVPPVPEDLLRGRSRSKELPEPPENSMQPETTIETSEPEAQETIEQQPTPHVDLPEESDKRHSDSRSSRSSQSGSKRLRTASWYMGGPGKGKPLPPPPPPSIPLPPIPTTPGVVNDVDPIDVSMVPSPSSPRQRAYSNASQVPQRSFESDHSEEDSLLQAFPTVPSLTPDEGITPISSVAPSEIGDGIDEIVGSYAMRSSLKAREKKVPGAIRVSGSRTHAHKDSGIGTPKTPLASFGNGPDSNSPTTEVVHDDGEDEGENHLSTEEQRRWYRLRKYVDQLDQQNKRGSIIERPTELGAVPSRRSREVKLPDEQALAAFEFGELQ